MEYSPTFTTYKDSDTITSSWGWFGPDPLPCLGQFNLRLCCRNEGGDESGILKVTILGFILVTALVSLLICGVRSQLTLCGKTTKTGM